jgi:CHAT domain-containing protein
VTTALSVLGFSHSGLLAANQLQRDPVRDPIETALAEGRSLRKAGQFAQALTQFDRALALAREQKNTEQTVRSLMLVATVQLLSFHYQSALAAAGEALQLARSSGNYRLAGGASGTIASIYRQLGDFHDAEIEGKLAIDMLGLARKDAPQAREFLASALSLQASLCYVQGQIAEGEVFFRQAIALAQQIGDKASEASAWDNRGVALLRDEQVSLADQSLNNAFALREALHDSDTLPISEEHLAELELKRAQPNYARALKLIDQALSSKSTSFKTDAQYYPIHIRAQILLGSRRKLQALAEFRRAVHAADIWRQGALPGDATNTQTVVLLHEIYKDFAHLAAQISLETNDSSLRDEAFQVLAANRAASLREQLRLALAADSKLPDSYFAKLSALQAAQARVTLGGNSKVDQADLARIRMQISDLENQITIQSGKNYFSNENNLRRNSLRDIQSRLSGSELLLSLSLGDVKSYLWAITGDQVNLFQLDSREKLEREGTQLTKAVRDGAGIQDAGQKLSHSLFSFLPARLAGKPEWLFVADGALLNGVPFAALPSFPAAGGGEWLLGKRSLRLSPSELLLLSPKARPPTARFVGVADPVYNQADSRLKHTPDWESPVEASSVTLARLAGSRQEVRAAARQSGLADQQILEGLQASDQALRKALWPPPELLHFAVHVVSPPDRSQEAALALSLNKDVPELLTPEAIATFRLPGSLVVLSGCSSGQGKAVPSAGLLGLSRAWLLAGATAVIASAWPTPDSSGLFFSSFYSHLHALKSGSLSQRAALALAQTQLEMQHSSGFTSLPSYWAAYSIVSKE